jgi:hypothetical protein
MEADPGGYFQHQRVHPPEPAQVQAEAHLSPPGTNVALRLQRGLGVFSTAEEGMAAGERGHQSCHNFGRGWRC